MSKKSKKILKNLRPYQQAAISAVKKELEAGISTQLLTMSMGLGKTFTAVKMTEQLGFKKVLWCTDDERLLEQSAMAFINNKFDSNFSSEINKTGFLNYIRQGGTFGEDGYKMGVIKADLFKPEGNVVFCSAQTLYRRLHLLNPNDYDCLIIDECHVFGSKTFFQGISHFLPNLRLGLSGTPFRKDGVLMCDIFEKIVFDYGMAEGIKDGWLCELDAVRIRTNCSLDKVHTIAGDFNEKELSNELNTLSRNNLIADSYLKYAKGRQAIGFGIDIQHCMDLTEAFQQKGINAVAISSDEERTGDKNAKIKAYRDGKIDVLWNVNLLSKGFDHPDTGCAISAAPTKSLVRYLQGPAGRPSRLKSAEYVAKFGQRAIIIDIVDNTTKHSIVNAWELDKGKDPEDRVFISQEKRDKLLAERERKAFITHTRDKDEKVKLLAVPKLKISNSFRMSEDATPLQLETIAKWGYEIKEAHYTKTMISEIFGKQPAGWKSIKEMKEWGYDVEGKFISIAEHQLAKKEHEAKLAKK